VTDKRVFNLLADVRFHQSAGTRFNHFLGVPKSKDVIEVDRCQIWS